MSNTNSPTSASARRAATDEAPDLDRSRVRRRGLAAPALAAPADAATLEKILARMEKLEARNAELEKEVKSLKTESDKVAQALDSDRISENEPELTSRLKAVEKDALNMKKSAKKIEELDGLKAGVALTTVAQKPSGLPHGTQDGNSQLNYRLDATVELPLKPMGDIEHKLFGHFRMGQGWAQFPVRQPRPLRQRAERDGLPCQWIQSGRLGRHPRRGLVPGQHPVALRRLQAALARKARTDLRQDGHLRLLRPEHGGRRRIEAVPQFGLRP